MPTPIKGLFDNRVGLTDEEDIEMQMKKRRPEPEQLILWGFFVVAGIIVILAIIGFFSGGREMLIEMQDYLFQVLKGLGG